MSVRESAAAEAVEPEALEPGVAESGVAPARPAGQGNVKVTRADWLARAHGVLIRDGVERIKILALAENLGVSRSSFYWYFKDRDDLLQALLEEWEARNTALFVEACAAPAGTITEGVLNLFTAFVDPAAFDPQLDFAVREWARRSDAVRAVLERSDATRLDAIAALFARHGFDEAEAWMRARVLYYMQIGYYALELAEDLETRLARVPGYLYGFTGEHARPGEIAVFAARAHALAGRTRSGATRGEMP